MDDYDKYLLRRISKQLDSLQGMIFVCTIALLIAYCNGGGGK